MSFVPKAEMVAVFRYRFLCSWRVIMGDEYLRPAPLLDLGTMVGLFGLRPACLLYLRRKWLPPLGTDFSVLGG